MSAIGYIAKMRAVADEMATTRKPLGDEEFNSYVLTGLGSDYNSLVTSIVTRVEPISFNELQAQILSFEQCLKLLHEGYQSSINSATRDWGSGGAGRGNCGRDGPPHNNNNSGRGRGGRGRNNGSPCRGDGGRRHFSGRCQVCFKEGHSVVQCWHRFDLDYVLDEHHVNVVVSSYGVDKN